MIAFGPVPSRRLGRSLGINNIPPKACTYSCVYCQVGRTERMQVERRSFYQPERILEEVRGKIERSRQAGEPIDYLTFVPDGEPTLDINLGREIELLKPLGVKIAVISNASLISRPDVRNELSKADWVSVKIDSTRQDVWRRVNRPHKSLSLRAILDGILEFARCYSGRLATETMLVGGMNDSSEDAEELARFLAELDSPETYLSVPIRPPAEEQIESPTEEVVNQFYQVLNKRNDRVEYLIGYEGNAFSSTGDAAEDLLSITAVHPMREEAVTELLERAGASWDVVAGLLGEHKLIMTVHEGHRFYLRTLRGRNRG
jgi:wyosine [tRNA(Phe)-imidazoG37] synthetase (radical SAM superfamily)